MNIFSIDGYAASSKELGYYDEDGKWEPNGAVEFLAKQNEKLRAQRDELIEVLKKVADTSVIYAGGGRAEIAKAALAKINANASDSIEGEK